MRQRALVWLSLPVAAMGCVAGHGVGSALVGPSRYEPLIHGYLAYAPQFLSACLAFVAIVLALRVSGRMQGRPAAWPFALLPPLVFCSQELIERLAAGLPAHTVLEPSVYAGLAAQLPIALVGFLAARALLRVADEAVRVLSTPPMLSLRPGQMSAPRPGSAPRSTALAFDHLGRAPPALLIRA